MIVFVLGIAVIAIIVGVIVLMLNFSTSGKPLKDVDVPTILTALGSAAIGAIAGLLAPNPNK